MSVHDKALQLQKRIFKALKNEAELLLGEMPDTIRQYERENQADFKSLSRICSTSKSQLIELVRNQDVTFVADFHTFVQAQRTALRIIRDAIGDLSTRTVTEDSSAEWMIGLEMIPSQFQSALDQFQQGQLTVDEFHETIAYQESWGFPWENYAPIFQWAKDNRVRLIALNRPLPLFSVDNERDLHDRDKWAAGVISDLFYANRKIRMIVLYGELHVGTQHLPYQLETLSKSLLSKPLKWLTIHQNEDKLFWKLAQDNRELDIEIVKLKKNAYCVLSSTPWAKLQSLVSWAEGCLPEKADPDRIESEPDYLSLIQIYGNTIAEFLEMPQARYEHLSLYSISKIESLESTLSRDDFSALEIRLILSQIASNQRIYIPKISAAYLGTPSQNGAAELAALHFLKTTTGCSRYYRAEPDDYFRQILESSFGFFGSLILNPRRKCDLFKDHLHRLEKLQQGVKPAYALEKEARELVVSMLQDTPMDTAQLHEVLKTRRLARANAVAAKYIGRILGKRLHQAVLEESAQIEAIRGIFFRRKTAARDFYENQHAALVEAISKVQVAPSKTEFL